MRRGPAGSAAARGAAIALLLGLLAATPGRAQAVYRCGPEGRDYSQAPCKDGRAVDVADPRSPAQRAAAREVARDDARRAEALSRERQAREAAAVRQAGALHTAPRPPQPAASSASKGKGKRPRAAAAAASAGRP